MERTYKYNNSEITIKFGNILSSEAEVIVSSDDCFISMGGGVSRSIRKKEGTGAIEDDSEKKVPARLGDVVVTTAGTLRQKFIFHAITIGFVNNTHLKGLPLEQIHDYIIKNTVSKCLNLMRYLNVTSIAFPTIGGGTANIPYKRIAKVMSESMADFFKRTSVVYKIELYIYTGSEQPNIMNYIEFFEQFASNMVLSSGYDSTAVLKTEKNSDDYDVFISYSRLDSVIADELANALKAKGVKCWIDRSGQYSGKNYKSVIVDKIRHSSIVMFISSQNSNESENVIKEISVAVELKKPIIPVKIDNTPYADSITYDLTGIDYIDYAMDNDILEQKILSQLTIIKNSQGEKN